MRSITWRITGLMFLTILVTVLLLVFMANYQMNTHFSQYLFLQQNSLSHHGGHGMMGVPEQIFLESIHQSLYWVGAVILAIGLFASYALARSITIPLRHLSEAVRALGKGSYGKTVAVESRDEVGLLAVSFNDMSKSLAAGETLRQRFLADAAHELKTPLAIIQGNLEAMLEGVVERSDETLASLHEETLHLSRMITDLRDLSLAEAGQLKLDKQSVDIAALLTRAIHMLQPLADEKKLALKAELEPSLPVLAADSGRMNQVFYNILTNAIRYSAEGDVIQVSAKKAADGRSVQITIRDTGCGIAPEDLPFIFNHFYRADKSRDRRSGGSGIGLAIARQLVENHGGRIEVESMPGQGSSFHIFLPLQ